MLSMALARKRKKGGGKATHIYKTDRYALTCAMLLIYASATPTNKQTKNEVLFFLFCCAASSTFFF